MNEIGIYHIDEHEKSNMKIYPKIYFKNPLLLIHQNNTKAKAERN